MESEEEQIAKMFNAGYAMQQHDPELLNKILKSANRDSEHVKALTMGKQQREREKVILEQQQIKERQGEKKHKR